VKARKPAPTTHPRRRLGRVKALAVVLGLLVVTSLAGAAPAQAAPDPCSGLSGAVRQACEFTSSATGLGGLVSTAQGAADAVNCATDPVGCVAKSSATAASWFLGRLADVLGATSAIDPSDPAVLRIYGLVFGLSLFLTLVVAILSIARSAGTGRTGEAVKTATAYLLLSLVASAFFPLAVFLGNELTDGVATAFSTVGAHDLNQFLHSTGVQLVAMQSSTVGGPFALLLFSLVTIICSLILWIELLLRKAAFYAVLVFAPAVFSGLTSERMWHHVKRYVYFLLALLACKPVVVIILSLAASLTTTSTDGSSILATCALLLMAIFSAGLLFKLIPHVGEQLGGAVNARRELSGAGPLGAIPGPASIARRSIQTHAVGRAGGGASKVAPAVVGAGASKVAPAVVGAGATAGLAGASLVAQRVTAAASSGAGSIGARRTGEGRSSARAPSGTPPPPPSHVGSGSREGS